MMRSEIKIKRVDYGDVSILHLVGDLAKKEAEPFKYYVEQMIDQGRCKIILDLEELRFIDSYAMKILLRLDRECMSIGGEIKLLRPRAVVKHFMAINQVFELFDCFETKTNAIHSFSPISQKNSQSTDIILESEKRQKIVIHRLIDILIQKGYFDSQVIDKEMQNSAQFILDIFSKELNSSS